MAQHLGAEIRKVLEEKGMTVSEFARRINKSRENVYSIFKRKSLDTELLSVISQVLHHEFNIHSGKRKPPVVTGMKEPRTGYTRIERELEFLREEFLHIRKELQYLRDRIASVEKSKPAKKK